MFSMTYIFFFVAVLLIKPNDTLFGIDTTNNNAVTSLMTEGNSVIQSASDQMNSALGGLTAVQNMLNEIGKIINSAVASSVTAAGGSPALIPKCMQKYQASISTFQINVLTKLTSNCVKNNLTEAISIIKNTMASIDIVNDIVVNVDSKVAAACPAPAAGDIIGGASNSACVLATVLQLTAQVSYQGVTIAANGVQVAMILSTLGPIVVDPGCVAFQLGFVAFDVPALIGPVVDCTRAPA